jgi:transposase
MEACTQSPAIAKAARAAKHETFVVPGQVVRALGVGRRGIKTDDRDAETLALASARTETLPSVHLRSDAARSRMQTVSARALLVRQRTQLALQVKSWLRGQLIRVTGRASSKHFASAVRKVATAELEGLPMPMEVLLSTFEMLTDKIAELDEQLTKHAENPTCQLLMTMPGIGPIAATMLVSHVDDIARFESSEQLTSYLGLVPGEATTGGKIVRTSVIKAGPTHLRAQLVQSAWSMWTARPNDPIVLWARGIAEKRGKRIAVIALGRCGRPARSTTRRERVVFARRARPDPGFRALPGELRAESVSDVSPQRRSNGDDRAAAPEALEGNLERPRGR